MVPITKYLVLSSGKIFDEVKYCASTSFAEGYIYGIDKEYKLFLYYLNDLPQYIAEYIRKELKYSIVRLFDYEIAFEYLPEFRNVDLSSFVGMYYDNKKKLTIFEFENGVEVKVNDSKILFKEIEVECVLLEKIGTVKVEIPNFIFECNEYPEFVLQYIRLNYPDIKITNGSLILIP